MHCLYLSLPRQDVQSIFALDEPHKKDYKALEPGTSRDLVRAELPLQMKPLTYGSRALDLCTVPPMRDLKINKLRAEFGICELHLKCELCLHERKVAPHLLATLCGWDARLEDVERRMRCSVCRQKKCTARAVPLTTPRGYKSHQWPKARVTDYKLHVLCVADSLTDS